MKKTRTDTMHVTTHAEDATGTPRTITAGGVTTAPRTVTITSAPPATTTPELSFEDARAALIQGLRLLQRQSRGVLVEKLPVTMAARAFADQLETIIEQLQE